MTTLTGKTQCTLYIDESGDLGANRGTQWFVLTGIVVNRSDEPTIRNVLSSVRTKLNMKSIHWRTIRDFYKKIYIMRQVAPLPFEYINIIFDTTKYDLKKIPSYDMAYNFLCKLLLERASWLLRDTGRNGEIVLSSRGTNRDNELIDYITNKLLPYPSNNIADVFSSATSKAASQWDLLQLADICATTTFTSLEAHPQYGFTTPCHASFIRDKLYARNGVVESYGIKYFAPDMKPSSAYLSERAICKLRQHK